MTIKTIQSFWKFRKLNQGGFNVNLCQIIKKIKLSVQQSFRNDGSKKCFEENVNRISGRKTSDWSLTFPWNKCDGFSWEVQDPHASHSSVYTDRNSCEAANGHLKWLILVYRVRRLLTSFPSSHSTQYQLEMLSTPASVEEEVIFWRADNEPSCFQREVKSRRNIIRTTVDKMCKLCCFFSYMWLIWNKT